MGPLTDLLVAHPAQADARLHVAHIAVGDVPYPSAGQKLTTVRTA